MRPMSVNVVKEELQTTTTYLWKTKYKHVIQDMQPRSWYVKLKQNMTCNCGHTSADTADVPVLSMQANVGSHSTSHSYILLKGMLFNMLN